MGIKKIEFYIKGNSSFQECEIINYCKKFVNSKQESFLNAGLWGNYLNYYYVRLFDFRTLKIWHIYSDASVEKFSINKTYKCNNVIVDGVIYLTPFIDKLQELDLRLKFIEEQLSDYGEEIEKIDNEVVGKILV